MNQPNTTIEGAGLESELRDKIATIFRFWWLVVLLPSGGGLVGYYHSSNQDTLYQASSTILVQYRGGGFDAGLSDSSKSNQLASTYRRLMTAVPFLERVDLLGASVSATTGTSPPTINVQVRHGDAVVTAAIAQELAESFIDYAIELQLSQIARLQAAANAQGIQIQSLIAAQFNITDNLILLEPVTPPGSPIVPQTRRNIQIGIFLGLMLAVGLAFLMENTWSVVRSPDDLERKFRVTSLGAIQKWPDSQETRRQLVFSVDSASRYSEDYRKLRSNLQFANSSKSHSVIMVASPSPAEGKSTVLANIALALTQTGQRVLVIDGDLRRPSIHSIFSLRREEMGLSNFLSDSNLVLDDVIQNTNLGVDVITSGPIPPNPAELLATHRMKTILKVVEDTYDMVLVDSPPLLVVADGLVIAAQVGGIIVIVDGSRTRPKALQVSLKAVGNSDVDILGVVVNKYKHKLFQAGPYYQYNDYEYYSYRNQEYGDDDNESHNKFVNRIKRIWSRIRKPS